MIPGDRVAAFRLIRPDGRCVFLIHQLFGARGNTALLDDQAKLLWAHHRPPHSLLTSIPPEEAWAHGEADATQQEFSKPALDFLTDHLWQTVIRQTRTPLERQLKAGRRLVENLTRDFDQADKGDLYRRKAEALAAHLHELKQGAESVEVDDPRDGKPLAINLDPAQTPAANMDAWFRRARKADKGHQIIAERLSSARSTATALDQALAEVEKIAAGPEPLLDRLALLQAWRADHVDLVGEKQKRAPGSRYGPEEPARPFRRYQVDGRWEVWVGRNNKENDELTHRAAHSRDIWLHAQGVPGSHVILRTAGKPEQVPRSVLEKAAALAALNSKARHSELVPVIHTQQRYVRKPRKSPPGNAVCLREKSLFVAPIIAPGVVSI
jgi:predicted ribosome quality control (RQC) complex YloA/Tae2 family protein